MIVQFARKRSLYEAVAAHRTELESAIARAIQESAAKNPEIAKILFSKTRTAVMSKAA